MSGHGEPEMLRLRGEDVASTPDRLPRRRGRQWLASVSAVVVVALVVLLAAVISRDAGSGRSATGSLGNQLAGRWSLRAITSGGQTWQAPTDSGFTLTFTATGYTGNDSCNGTSGTLSYKSGTVHLGSGAMTELGCIGGDKDRMQTAFRQLIDQDLPVSLSGSTLTLTAGPTVFALSRVQPAVPVDLSKTLPGTTWALVSVGTIGKDVSSSSPVPASVSADISFRTKDFSANDGCNSHSGDLAYTPRTVSFGDGEVTEAYCEGPNGAYGSAYTSVLLGKVTPTIVGDTLTLATPKTSLTFARETPAWVEQRITANSWTLRAVGSGGAVTAVAPGWTLTMTATSYEAKSQCETYSGAVSYGVQLLMQAGTRDVSCALAQADSPVKAYQAVFAGSVDVGFGHGLTLSANGSTLEYAMGTPTGAAVSASPVPSAVATGGIADMKSTLIASTWKLLSLKTPTASWQAIATSTANLTLTDKGYQASDGCDSQGTAVVYDESAATVDFTRGGEMSEGSCSFAAPGPPKGSLAPQAYFDALLGPLHVALSGDALTLTRTGVVLTFSREAPTTQTSPPAAASGLVQASSVGASAPRSLLVDQLVGWFWQIESTTVHGVTTPATAGSWAAINFSRDSLDASDGCGNDWSPLSGATYRGSTITMHTVAVSAVPCAETPLLDAYRLVLRDAVTARVAGKTLTMSAHGAVLVFTRAHAASYKSDFLAPIPAPSLSPS